MPSLFEVTPIEEKAAKAFVVAHHYSRSYPAARYRVGLFERLAFRRPQLVGVAVFSVPMNNAAIRHYSGQDLGVELGRFVLLDHVPANAESWFLARALRFLACPSDGLPDVRAVISYSDPVARLADDGRTIMPGHVGTIYQASNARYCGRSRARTLWLAADGRVVSERTLSKVRLGECGAGYAYEQMRSLGAPPRSPFEDGPAYVARALAEGPFRRLRHPGNHAYLFAVGNRLGRKDVLRAAAPALPYPKAA